MTAHSITSKSDCLHQEVPQEELQEVQLNKKQRRGSLSGRSVHFDEQVTVRLSLHYYDYTKDERHACWYTHREFRSQQQGIRDEIKRLESGAQFETREPSCIRGLECRLSENATKRAQRKYTALDTVLTEQELQSSEGSYDPAYIAELYTEVSALDAEKALSRGLQDELAALE